MRTAQAAGHLQDSSSRGQDTPARIVVMVWFGDHLLSSYVAEPALAARFATAMQRRLTGVRITTAEVRQMPWK
ncbi:hypothetical protein ACIA49_01375 [Kribbella sp. NPDC051587]|uniref:hypothetical protein n=1 Tax=Kribbella sp. NPDC051587 TaxID=3364119 RepID=UPI00378E2F00